MQITGHVIASIKVDGRTIVVSMTDNQIILQTAINQAVRGMKTRFDADSNQRRINYVRS